MKLYLIRLFHNLSYCNDSKKRGFTIIEAVLALFIFGASLGAIFGFQTVLLKSTFKAHEFILRLLYIKNFFIKADIDKLYKKSKQEKKIDNPELILNYSSKKFDNFKNVVLEKVEANWSSGSGKYREVFLTFKFDANNNKSEN